MTTDSATNLTLPAAASFNPSAAERHQMIAVAAYFLAEHRHFAPGSAETDWISAEQQIDQMLAVMREHGRTRQDLEQVGLRNALLLWTNCVPAAQ